MCACLLADLRHVWHLAELRGAEREREERGRGNHFPRSIDAIPIEMARGQKERKRREDESLA